MQVRGVSRVLLLPCTSVVKPQSLASARSHGVAGGQRSLHCPALRRASPPVALAGRWEGLVSIEFQLFSGKYLSIEIEEL